MAVDKESLLDWVQALPAGTLVGIDEGGLCLTTDAMANDDELAYYEIGGMPLEEEEP